MRNAIHLLSILMLFFVVSCSEESIKKTNNQIPKLTLPLANSVLDKDVKTTFYAVLEYKNDGYFIKGYFVHPIMEIKYPGYELNKFNDNEEGRKKYEDLARKKASNESVIIQLKGKVRNRGPVTHQLNPETEHFGVVYDYSIIDMYLGPTPKWKAYRVKEME